MPSPRQLLWSLVVLIATFVAYAPVLGGGFIWDDDDYVTANPLLHDGESLARIWLEPSSLPQYYPVVHTVFWLEARVFGFRAPGYHVVNVLLHALAALAFAGLLARLGLRGARLAALLFALHPLKVESAAWVTEHKNTLSLLFALLSARAYLAFEHRTREESAPARVGLYLAALFLFALALFSKSVTCSLPAVILLLSWWREGHVSRRQVVALSPFFVLGLLMGAATVVLEKHHVLATGAPWDLDIWQRFLIAGRAFWFYVIKLLVPTGLSFNYPRWDVSTVGIVGPAALIAAVAVPILLWRRRHHWGRGPLVAALIYGGVLFPALGFIDTYPMRYSFVADHFAYHALLAPIALASSVLFTATRSWSLRTKTLGVVLLCGALSFLTFRHAEDFHDMERLWRSTLDANPKSWLAANNLAGLLIDRGSDAALAEALTLSEQVIATCPEQAGPAWANRGIVLYRLGQREEAHQSLQRATQVDPRSPQAWSNLGAIRAQDGFFEEAEQHFRKALDIEPRFTEARKGLVLSLAHQGKGRQALREFDRVALPKSEGAFLVRFARALEQGEAWDATAAVIARRIASEPGDVDARRLAARIEEKRRQPARALTIYLSILAQRPDDQKARGGALRVARSLPEPSGALVAASHGMRVSLAPLCRDLALLLLDDGRRGEARRVLQEALSLARKENDRTLLGEIKQLLSEL